MTLKALDFAVVLGFLLVLTAVGWWSRRFVHGVADFVVARRKMRKYLGLTTESAQGWDIATLAAGAEQGFLHGFAYIWISLLGAAIVIPIFGVLGFGVERLRATKAMTLAQFHEMQYGKGVRLTIGVIMAVGGIMNMAIFPVIGCSYLRIFLGLSDRV